MGGFIPGPVIKFQVDAPGLSAAVAPAMQDVRNQARATSQAIADDWRRMAAQMRASVSLGVTSQKDMNVAHAALVTSLDKEINLLRQRDQLSTKELANLKAMTLERERQASALKIGGPGLTRGTEQALGQVSTQTTLGIERMVDSLVNRYLGGAAGALFRTARDVSYYSAQASGTTGGSGGIFSSFTSGAGTIMSSISPVTAAVGTFTAALAAEAAILGSVSKHMVDYAQSIQNTAAATGLSVVQVQQYNELAKITGVEAGSLETAFSRLQVQLGEMITRNKDAASGNQNFGRVLKELGISADDSTGKLRPVNDIIGDFARQLDTVQNPATRTALTMEALGTRGRVLAQIMEEARASGQSLSEMLTEMNKVTLPESEINQLLKEKAAWDGLTISIDAAKIKLEGYIATHLGTVSINPFAAASGAAGFAFGQFIRNHVTNPGAPTVNAPSPADAAATMAKDAAAANVQLLRQAEIIKDGGLTQYNLAQAEKNYAEAVKDGQGAIAEQYAKQIASLQNIVGLEKSRAEIAKRFRDDLYKENLTTHPNEKDQTLNFLLQNLTGGTPAQQARALASSLPSNVTSGTNLYGPLGPIGSGAPSNEEITAQAQKVHQELIDLNMSAEDKIRQQYNDELDYWKFIQQQFPIYAQEASNAIIDIKKVEAQKLQELADKAFEKYKNEAGQLFDSLISGNTKDFSKKLQKDIEDIVLDPIKTDFENTFGKMLQDLAGLFGGGSSSGSTTGSASGSNVNAPSGGFIGKLLSKAFSGFGIQNSPNAPGGTAGWWHGSLGLGGGKSGTGPAGQLATQAMYVQAQVVYLSGGGLGTGTGTLGNGIGSDFFSNNLSVPYGVSSFFTNNNPFAGNGPLASYGNASGGSQNPLAAAVQAAVPGLLMGGLAALHGNTPAEAIAAGTTAASVTKAIAPNSAFAGKLGQGFQGAGLLAAGISQGGVTGGLEDVAGGAQIGTAIAPGIGTAIGAAVGAMIGIVNGIFGADSWQNRVKAAMNNQAIYLPPSENFSFASNGSIGSTLSTGFSQSGQTLSQYGINQPFYANAIYGPLTNAQKLQLAQTELGMNSNQPFLGFPNQSTSPFEGGSIPGYKTYPTAPMPYIGNGPLGFNPPMSQPAPEIHFHIPNYVDQHSASFVFKNLAPTIADAVAPHLSRSIYTSSSGMSNGVRTAVNLP
jgi:hypothetical protein